MAGPFLLPSTSAAVVDADRRMTRELRDFLRQLATQTDNVALAEELNQLAQRVSALESEDTPQATIKGLDSIRVLGSLESGFVQITLEGDADLPGNTYYYGTGPDGAKGFYAVADALVQGAGVALTVAADGTIEIAHADTSAVTDISANFTGGTVPGEISLTFDQFGHVLTRTITGRTLDHNDTGGLQGGNATERYHFTAAEHAGLLPWVSESPADYALLTQTITNGDTTHAPSGDAVFDALAGKEPTIAAGTTGQFWRGDKAFTNILLGPVGINIAPAADTGMTILADAFPHNGIEVISDTPGLQANITATTYGTNGGGIFHGRMARGTMAAPTAVLSDDIYGGYGCRPFRDNGTFASSSPVSTHFVAKETQTPTAMGGCYRILTTPVGSATRTVRIVASDKEDVIFGTMDNQPASSFDGRGTAVVRQGSAEHIVYTHGGSGLGAGLRGVVASGTIATPAATQSGQGVFVSLCGHDGAAYSVSSQALLSLEATQNWTSTAKGAQAVIATTQNGTTSRVNRVWVSDTGDVGIGTATTNPLANADLNLMLSAATSGDRLARINIQGSRTTNAPYATLDFYHQNTRVSQFVAGRGVGGAAAGGFYWATKSNAGSLTPALAITENQNVNLGNEAGDANSGGVVGGVYIKNVVTAPTSAPTGGGVLYVEAGALKFRGSSGTITVIAPA